MSSNDKKAPPGAARAKPAADSFEATVAIDATPGGKKLQAVWLVRGDGERWVIDYRARGLWLPFKGQRVRVTGATYMPEGQAIGATHFRIATMQMLDDKSTASLIWLGPKQTLEGTLSIRRGAAGTKLGDQSYPIFTTTSGSTFLIANGGWTKTGAAKITAREAKRSPFIAHMGGRLLWILHPSP